MSVDGIKAVAVAGGGTGGHLFPGIAIAEEFRKTDEETQVLYIGAAGKLEERIVPARGMLFHGLKLSGFAGLGPGRKAAALWRAFRGFAECRGLLRKFGPDVLVGVGGYSSFPAAAAAWTLGIPLVIQEQNTVPGLANRLLGKIARRVFLTFDEAAVFFPKGKSMVTGNPIRTEVITGPDPVGEGERLQVLVLGGSRGAAGVNRVVSEALEKLGARAEGMIFLHQSGEEERDAVEKAYRAAGVQSEVLSFIDDMGDAYRRADVVISRSGAGAVAEIAANALPAILIPFPHAAGGHQQKNAYWLEAGGGARVVEEGDLRSGEKVAEALDLFSRKRDVLKEASEASRRVGKRDAATKIVSECRRMAAAEGG